jgi:hypothetical protein
MAKVLLSLKMQDLMKMELPAQELRGQGLNQQLASEVTHP